MSDSKRLSGASDGKSGKFGYQPLEKGFQPTPPRSAENAPPADPPPPPSQGGSGQK